MFRVLLLAALAVLSQATPVIVRAPYTPAPIYVQPATYVAPVVVKEAPKPYAFAYDAPAIGGGSSRQETSDGNGRVTGSYTLTDADGRIRVVDYYADETGFHANVKTNEPGTANQDSADVTVQSYAPPAVAPVAPPKVVVAAAPAPVYTVAAPVATSYVAPVSYSVPTYNYRAPVTYGGYYGSYAPYYRSYAPKLVYYK
ncbi:adult-specific rigid cuticular protein 15.7-like [Argiope bruennichi]|uniref:adult-specific rigid cuticular protein 15.7-like n=1 Tax=Argiope bruennichi TaxID=94029 RepID=UPI0024957C11|nr:adult-specific rigid cuticular protein 15.7-like [Argiope bruennichi]